MCRNCARQGLSMVEIIVGLVLAGFAMYAASSFFRSSRGKADAFMESSDSLSNVVMPLRALRADLKRARKLDKLTTAGVEAIQLSIGIYDSTSGILQKDVFYELKSEACPYPMKGANCKTLVRSEGTLGGAPISRYPGIADLQWCYYLPSLSGSFHDFSALPFAAPGTSPLPAAGKRFAVQASMYSASTKALVPILKANIDLENFDHTGGAKALRFIK